MRLALALAVLLAAPTAARADIIGVADSHAAFSGTGTDIVMFDANTGEKVALPSTINTADDETHPSISASGSRLVFERDAGATRVLLATLPDGTLHDLFNGIEQSSNPQSAPAISSDGNTVLTGERFQPATSVVSALTLTDISSTFAPPFPRSQYATQYGYGSGAQSGQSADPAISGNLLAWTSTQTGALGGMILAKNPGVAALPQFAATISFSHPALGAPGGTSIVVFDKRPSGGKGDIVFRETDPLSPRAGPTITALPPIVNSPQDESHPAFTPDGRYIGFIRDDTHHSRAFVWDVETQTLVNEDGFDLGDIHQTVKGSLSLYNKQLFQFTRVSRGGFVSFLAINDTGVGILVQRIVGKHKLFGRTVPTLKTVGRVPLGRFKKGRGKVRWNGQVGGRRLKPGRYLVTVRAVSPKGVVLDLGKPVTFTVS